MASTSDGWPTFIKRFDEWRERTGGGEQHGHRNDTGQPGAVSRFFDDWKAGAPAGSPGGGARRGSSENGGVIAAAPCQGSALLASALLFRARNLLHGVCPSHAACYSGRRCKHCKEMLIVMRARGWKLVTLAHLLRRAGAALAVLGLAAGLLVAGGGPAMAASISTTQLQWDLAGLGYLPMSGIDGTYGPQTTAAVRAFQTDQCLSVDGIAGPQTDGALSGVVQLVQEAARAAADGMYGPGTESAVNTWQSQHELTADGIAGPATMGAMSITRNHQCSGPPSGSPSPGSSSSAQLQWDLAGLGYLSWSGIDGIVGPQTQSATQAFQTDRCLSVDGIAGPQTNGALASIINSVQQVAGTTQDGAYGPNTRAAVASWQAAHGVPADGQAGPDTMSKMGITRVLHCSGPLSGTPGPSASATTQLQWDLAGLGYLPWSGIDGITGPQTAGATEAFQSDRCLTVDGIAGPQTNGALASVINSVQQVAGATQDGGYGPSTKAAVASWQADHGLTADGQAGPQTMSKMGITRVLSGCSPPGSGTPLPGDMGNAIVSVATAELNNPEHNHEEPEGSNCNFYTTYYQGRGIANNCSNGWRSEDWCADFADYVWQKAGAVVGGIGPAAASFNQYGLQHGTAHGGTPRVGDAAVIGLDSSGTYADHVGLVVAVGNGSFTMISGNAGPPVNGFNVQVWEETRADSSASVFVDPVGNAPAPNNKTAFDFFTGSGLSKVQAAAIVGNFDQESSMNPRQFQYPSGPGRGIAQWSAGGRWDTDSRDNMVWYASQHGESQWELTPQLQFSWYELATYPNYGLASLRAATTVYNAVVAFQSKFEGCGTCMTDNRVRYADQALTYYG